METQREVKKTSVKRWVINVVSLILGITLLLVGLSRLGVFGPSKSSQPVGDKIKQLELNVKLQEIDGLSSEASSRSKSISDLFSKVSEKEGARDYAAAAKLTGDGLKELADLVGKIDAVSVKIREFKTLAQTIQDQTIKTNALNLADLMQQRNDSFLKVLDYMKQIAEPAKKYYDALASGKSAMPPAQTALSQKMIDELKTLADVGQKVKDAAEELIKSLNIK